MLGKGLESLIPNKGAQVQEPQGAPASLVQEKIEETKETSAAPSPREEVPHAPPQIAPVSEKSQVPPREHRSFPRTGEGDSIFHIEVEKIYPNPHQPRRDFNEESIRELADSIREFGILQPVIVTKIEKEVPTGTAVEYELIAGERRLKAAKLLGMERVPAIIKKDTTDTDRLEMAIIENLQRQNLTPIETARAFARLQDEFRMTQREIASRLGKSRETVANTLRLLDLPSYIQEALTKGFISETHGRLLLAVTDKSAQEKLFRDLLDRHLTTRDLKARVHMAQSPHEPQGVVLNPSLSPELKMLEERLTSELGAPVKIEQKGQSGKITISFYSGEELKNILGKLGRGED